MAKEKVLEQHKTVSELIHSIEHKDRRFRVAQTIFMLAITIAIALAGYFLATNQTKERINRENQTNTIISEQSKKIDALAAKIQCLSNFFSQPDRQNLVIKDPNVCFIEGTGNSQSLFTSPEPGNSTQNNNTKPITSQEGNTNNPAPGQNQSNSQDQHPAVGVDTPLGRIDACIPFTAVCVRR